MNLKRKKQIPRFQSSHTQGRIGKTLWHKAFGKKPGSTKITTPAATPSTPVPVASVLAAIVAHVHLLAETQADSAGIIATQA